MMFLKHGGNMEKLPSLSLKIDETQVLKLSIVECDDPKGMYNIIPQLCKGENGGELPEIHLIDPTGTLLSIEGLESFEAAHKALEHIEQEFSRIMCIGNRVIVKLNSPRVNC